VPPAPAAATRRRRAPRRNGGGGGNRKGIHSNKIRWLYPKQVPQECLMEFRLSCCVWAIAGVSNPDTSTTCTLRSLRLRWLRRMGWGHAHGKPAGCSARLRRRGTQAVLEQMQSRSCHTANDAEARESCSAWVNQGRVIISASSSFSRRSNGDGNSSAREGLPRRTALPPTSDTINRTRLQATQVPEAEEV
jgi:hypothetical protein